MIGRHLVAVAGQAREFDAQIGPFGEGADLADGLGDLDPPFPRYREEAEGHAVDLGVLWLEKAVRVGVVRRTSERPSFSSTAPSHHTPATATDPS